ncbi:hypothetical protein R83H12_00001 [Fibrobacteria bacterium R8-3-H12]
MPNGLSAEESVSPKEHLISVTAWLWFSFPLLSSHSNTARSPPIFLIDISPLPPRTARVASPSELVFGLKFIISSLAYIEASFTGVASDIFREPNDTCITSGGADTFIEGLILYVPCVKVFFTLSSIGFLSKFKVNSSIALVVPSLLKASQPSMSQYWSSTFCPTALI